MSSMEQADLVIVGGGIGGLYLAWRLRDSGLKITLLEKYDRFGGRIYTVEVPGGFKAEMGAMRFLPKSHLILQHLIDHFSLEKEPLFVNKSGMENKISHYWRNKRVTLQQLKDMHNIRLDGRCSCQFRENCNQLFQPGTNYTNS